MINLNNCQYQECGNPYPNPNPNHNYLCQKCNRYPLIDLIYCPYPDCETPYHIDVDKYKYYCNKCKRCPINLPPYDPVKPFQTKSALNNFWMCETIHKYDKDRQMKQTKDRKLEESDKHYIQNLLEDNQNTFITKSSIISSVLTTIIDENVINGNVLRRVGEIVYNKTKENEIFSTIQNYVEQELITLILFQETEINVFLNDFSDDYISQDITLEELTSIQDLLNSTNILERLHRNFLYFISSLEKRKKNTAKMILLQNQKNNIQKSILFSIIDQKVKLLENKNVLSVKYPQLKPCNKKSIERFLSKCKDVNALLIEQLNIVNSLSNWGIKDHYISDQKKTPSNRLVIIGNDDDFSIDNHVKLFGNVTDVQTFPYLRTFIMNLIERQPSFSNNNGIKIYDMNLKMLIQDEEFKLLSNQHQKLVKDVITHMIFSCDKLSTLEIEKYHENFINSLNKESTNHVELNVLEIKNEIERVMSIDNSIFFRLLFIISASNFTDLKLLQTNFINSISQKVAENATNDNLFLQNGFKIFFKDKIEIYMKHIIHLMKNENKHFSLPSIMSRLKARNKSLFSGIINANFLYLTDSEQKWSEVLGLDKSLLSNSFTTPINNDQLIQETKKSKSLFDKYRQIKSAPLKPNLKINNQQVMIGFENIDLNTSHLTWHEEQTEKTEEILQKYNTKKEKEIADMMKAQDLMYMKRMGTQTTFPEMQCFRICMHKTTIPFVSRTFHLCSVCYSQQAVSVCDHNKLYCRSCG